MTFAATEFGPLSASIQALQQLTRSETYKGKIYLVGGLLRDLFLGLPLPAEYDLVVEGDAVELAKLLHRRGFSRHFPVLYPRFGTAMLHAAAPAGDGPMVEIVSARSETYAPTSRKPNVQKAALEVDAFRRDFTINTLMQNIHTGEIRDLTGAAQTDLHARIVRTPRDPEITFHDDPLRMLRAIRFAARLRFTISPETWQAIQRMAGRLRPPAVSRERIKEEFVKIASLPGPRFRAGLQMLLDSNLLEQFLPELLPMVGCGQNQWHLYDVWTHTLVAIENLPDEARLALRLGLMWHDAGKPATKSEDERGVHFYGHQQVGAEMCRAMMSRLRFSSEEIRDATALVALHMRIGEYKQGWTDAAVKRLIRDCGSYLEDLIVLARCDIAASNIAAGEIVDLEALQHRIDALNALRDVRKIESPLTGYEIMEELHGRPGRYIADVKEFLTNEVIEGRLEEGDRETARAMIAQRTWPVTR
ncbi:MAG TPA: CCA tRNA nucleotidyltransferase [Chthonomonadales bacterium]|nr:CCA tRNA nucleotidyltransferase [Chthonomonadales bacterium]